MRKINKTSKSSCLGTCSSSLSKREEMDGVTRHIAKKKENTKWIFNNMQVCEREEKCFL